MGSKIGGFFGRSALGPLAEQMIKARETVDQLPALFEAMFKGDRDKLRAVVSEIDKLEGQTDDIKDEIRGQLSRSMFSSVERGDILALTKVLDTVSDRCNELAKFVSLRPTAVPAILQPKIKDLVDIIVKTVDSLDFAIDTMHELEEKQALKHDMPRVEEMLRQVAVDEHSADRCEAQALVQLFEHEKEIDPVSVIFLLRIIEATGRVADAAENVSDGFRRLFCTR